jgi:predicted  nucleic acid-binding Zn-ribbon protein
MAKDLLARLDALKEQRARAKAELDVAQKHLDEALAKLKELGIDTSQDLDALKAEVDRQIAEFERQIAAAEAEIGSFS